MKFVRFVLLVPLAAACATTNEGEEIRSIPEEREIEEGAVMMPRRTEGRQAPQELPRERSSVPIPVVQPEPPETPAKTDESGVPEITVAKPDEADKAAREAEKEAAKKQASQRVGKRSEDGIDNNTPIPPKGAARDAFERAVNTSRQNPAQAATEFKDAATRTTYFYAAHYNAGVASERAGDNSAAEASYKKAIEVRPDFGPALTNLMLLLRRTGRSAEGDRVVDSALVAHADKAGPHVAAATRALVKGDLKKVESSALTAVRIDERNVTARRLMARVFFAQGRYETAKFALENALILEPGNALLLLELGHVQVKLEKEDDALKSFNTAARLRPELAEAHENAGVLLLAKGDAPAALSALRTNARLRPNAARPQLLLGNALRASKLYQEAEAAYLRALKRDGRLSQAHFNLGILYMDNAVPGVEELARLKKSKASFDAFKKAASPRGRLGERVKDYLTSVDRRIKRIERRQKRAAEKAKSGDPGNSPDGGGV